MNKRRCSFHILSGFCDFKIMHGMYVGVPYTLYKQASHRHCVIFHKVHLSGEMMMLTVNTHFIIWVSFFCFLVQFLNTHPCQSMENNE